MAPRAAQPVTAGLHRLAELDRRERARIVRHLCASYPAFRSLLRTVTVARGVVFASSVVVLLAVLLLADGAALWVVIALVLTGLAGFAAATVVLTDNRFDLLLAVLGAHRTDELHRHLLAEQIYGADPATTEAERSDDAT